MSRSFKLMCRMPIHQDTTSFYRAMGPLQDLRRQMDLDMYSPETFVWSTMGADALFLQRPYTKNDAGVVEMCKRYKIPIWVDYDDFLFALGTDNPAYWTYMKESVHKNMAYCLREATVVTVSTGALAERLKSFNKNIVVIPNAIDLRINARPKPLPKRTKRVSWRGSATHHRDVFSVCQTLFRVHEEFKDWEWHFFGDNLWLLTDNMDDKRTFLREPTDWGEYFDRIYDCAPSVMMAPLHPSGFNLCKSNIAWIEAAYAGAVTIAPSWPEWDQPGVLKYETETDLYEQFKAVMSGDVDVENDAAEAWEYICDNLALSKVNKLRLDVLASLRG